MPSIAWIIGLSVLLIIGIAALICWVIGLAVAFTLALVGIYL